jgi:hypothetical protein
MVLRDCSLSCCCLGWSLKHKEMLGIVLANSSPDFRSYLGSYHSIPTLSLLLLILYLLKRTLTPSLLSAYFPFIQADPCRSSSHFAP